MAKRKKSRKATVDQADFFKESARSLVTDESAMARIDDGTDEIDVIYALPEEEHDMMRKVDYSVLQTELPSFQLLNDEAIDALSLDMLRSYAHEISDMLVTYANYAGKLHTELFNAYELYHNMRKEKFGSSSQRFTSLFGDNGKEMEAETDHYETVETSEASDEEEKAEAPVDDRDSDDSESRNENGNTPDNSDSDRPAEEQDNGTEGENSTRKKKNRKPTRTDGCASKCFDDDAVVKVNVTLSEETLREYFGEGGWREMPSRIQRECQFCPARILVVEYSLATYAAKQPMENPDAPEIIRAESPATRIRPNSPLTSSIMSQAMYMRNSLRMPPNRVCRYFKDLGYRFTPQRMYENLSFYGRYFQCLTERAWTLLLNSPCIQIDETPVRWYDSIQKKYRRGYFWVFTTSEMCLDKEHPITLFYFSEGRSADTLRECLSGYTGVIGSDGHSAYQVFERESDGKVINAGCLDHFRKRVVRAVNAIPGIKEMSEEEKLKYPSYLIMLKLGKVFLLERKTKQLDSKEARDEWRDTEVREAFEDLVKTTLSFDLSNEVTGSYFSKAVTYMKNQQVHLEKFLDNSDISSNNSNCERKFVFFSVLRAQSKMWGSREGLETAATLESIEQTAREHGGNTRYYYQFLLEQLIPFINKNGGVNADFSQNEEIDKFFPWTKCCAQQTAAIKAHEDPLLKEIVSRI